MLIPPSDISPVWSIASCLKFNDQRTTYFQSLQGTSLTSMDYQPRPGFLILSLQWCPLSCCLIIKQGGWPHTLHGRRTRQAAESTDRCYYHFKIGTRGSFCHPLTLPKTVVNESRERLVKTLQEGKLLGQLKTCGNSWLTTVFMYIPAGYHFFPKQSWRKIYNEMRSRSAGFPLTPARGESRLGLSVLD